MDVTINRKRSRASTSSTPDDSRAATPFTDTLKRTKTDNELDSLNIIHPSEAWPIDISAILASPTIPTVTGSSLQPYDNAANHTPGKSIYILCIQGDYELHYDLLCSHLPTLHLISPTLQAFLLCRDPSTHTPSHTAPFCLPMIQAVSPSHNHFVKLGLLHPLGGGQYPLDAVVVLDARGRRRLVLPFGWGAGRHVDNVGGGKGVQDRLMGMLRGCVEELEREM
ncbi:hypothetical protein GQ43DRAFT_374892 [Delitschia confertaspora ATCC 74209]|uniref:Uncharacterized protein n=1 Tax=Delitschia confertaspora ATCC 74209 TaxID=1513339 RepID=A0A9P4JMU3_9PLEO|nr:hypothetical protein GQ43DRAFT_374892 [Delitschia confertaspora ATCC 74209]